MSKQKLSRINNSKGLLFIITVHFQLYLSKSSINLHKQLYHHDYCFHVFVCKIRFFYILIILKWQSKKFLFHLKNDQFFFSLFLRSIWSWFWKVMWVNGIMFKSLYVNKDNFFQNQSVVIQNWITIRHLKSVVDGF